MFLNESRREYTKYKLDQDDAFSNPLDQFQSWFEFAKKNAVFESNAMHLSTISSTNQAKNRVVLLKSYNEDGFVFFTNYNSQKFNDIRFNPNVSLTFFWPNIERQIRIEGKASKTKKEISDTYFNTRPRDSQLSAWASAQSQPIESRQKLEAQLELFKEKFPTDIPRPEHWGGVIVNPTYFEFWQGRKNRYHDRITYTKNNEVWNLQRICP
ncbi:MAG: pyridoxamine 5'-phosphate oxidase [Candidatus Margulisiibacteriota bacterium]